MHELSLCAALAGVAKTHADGRHVDVVRVRIGAATGVQMLRRCGQAKMGVQEVRKNGCPRVASKKSVKMGVQSLSDR